MNRRVLGGAPTAAAGASAALCSVNTALPPLFVYVINLRSRAERYHKLKQLLLQLRPPCGSRQEASGTEWLRVERIEASDGRDEAARRYNPGFRLTFGGVLRWTLPHWRLLWRVRGYWTRDVTSGEAGLYLSHMRALRRIAENSHSDALHLVLEDDAFFAPSHLAERLYGLHRRLSAAVGVGGWDVVNLGPDFPGGPGTSVLRLGPSRPRRALTWHPSPKLLLVLARCSSRPPARPRSSPSIARSRTSFHTMSSYRHSRGRTRARRSARSIYQRTRRCSTTACARRSCCRPPTACTTPRGDGWRRGRWRLSGVGGTRAERRALRGRGIIPLLVASTAVARVPTGLATW